MTLTSGENLHIIGVYGRRAIYCGPMASNMKSEGSIVLQHSMLCSAPALCRKVGAASWKSQQICP
jgi:DNA primase large subunit